MKTVWIFRCDALLKSETKEQIRQHLLKQLDEGVVVTDASLEYVKTVLPKGCTYDVIVETMEEEEVKASRT